MSPLFALLLALMVSGCGINNIPTFDEQAKAKWSDVQNQYQRRADLIPNLVETVKGYAKQEKDVLEGDPGARPGDADQGGRQYRHRSRGVQEIRGRAVEIVRRPRPPAGDIENYPDLKSNQNFLALQSQLEGTENRIAVARRDYIEAVRVYNTELKTLPGSIWASTVYRSYKPMQTFAATAPQADQPPSVKF